MEDGVAMWWNMTNNHGRDGGAFVSHEVVMMMNVGANDCTKALRGLELGGREVDTCMLIQFL